MEKKENRKGLIYCATNKSNGKMYIGQTIRGLERRKYHHFWCSEKRNTQNNYFMNALAKYGEGGFDWDILEDNVDIPDLDEREKFHIKEKGSFIKGYNLNEGGGSREITEESRKKMSIAKRKMIAKNKEKYGTPFPCEWMDKLKDSSKRRIGSKDSFEVKKRKSDAQKGKTLTEECKEKLRKINTGKNHTEESKRKMSLARMGDKNHFKGKHHTDESKIKNAIGNHKRGVLPTNSSGFKGVQKMGKKWRVTMRYMGKTLYFGVFEDKVEAAKVYDEKLIELYGKENVTTNKNLGLY